MSNFQPIAMRCTQEDFYSIKHLIKYEEISDFENFPYLTNNLANVKGICSNIIEEDKNSYSRKVYEEFNADIFLKSLKEEEETYKIVNTIEVVKVDDNKISVESPLAKAAHQR